MQPPVSQAACTPCSPLTVGAATAQEARRGACFQTALQENLAASHRFQPRSDRSIPDLPGCGAPAEASARLTAYPGCRLALFLLLRAVLASSLLLIPAVLSPPSAHATIPGFPCYRTIAETHAAAQALAAADPTLAALLDIGDSWEKSPPVDPQATTSGSSA